MPSSPWSFSSRQVDSVTQFGSNVLVICTAKFEKDDKVTIRLSLEQADPHHVSGLCFSSPTLSQEQAKHPHAGVEIVRCAQGL
jgi:hypothetical protein